MSEMFQAQKNLFFARVQDGKHSSLIRVVKLRRRPQSWPKATQRFKKEDVAFEFTVDATAWRELNEFLGESQQMSDLRNALSRMVSKYGQYGCEETEDAQRVLGE
jgi:hypothetical protein